MFEIKRSTRSRHVHRPPLTQTYPLTMALLAAMAGGLLALLVIGWGG